MSEPVRLLLVTGTRAEFGLWTPILREADARGPRIAASLLATGMHFDPRFGATAEEVRSSGFAVAAEVPVVADGDARADMAVALGRAVAAMAPVLAQQAPDWLLLLGDRGEQLAAALAALHLGIPMGHLHGGEVTRGAVDDTFRDLITRIAHLHLAATDEAAERLRRMGEERWRIHRVGAPGLDLLRQEAGGDLAALRARHGLGADGPYLLVVQHPETVGRDQGVDDLEATLRAVRAVGLPALAVYPNADAGGRAMADRLDAGGPSLRVVASLPRADYATLLAGAAAVVGNSSSGIIEAPLLRVPAVNVGRRQEGRTRGDNVLDVPPDAERIASAIRRALGPGFRETLSGQSPYGDGTAAARILDLVESTPRDERLLMKRWAEGSPSGR